MTQVQTVATLAEAASAQGQILGGGTLLMRQVNYAPQEVPHLVRVTDPGLREITAQGDRIRIGAQVTMAQVMASGDLAALAPAARSIGGPALRNMATVGGNLFAPHPYGDFTVALLAVEARVHWASGQEEALDTFLARRGNAAGLVAAVSVPRVRPEELRFAKVSRTKPKGVSVLSIAAHLVSIGSRLERCTLAFGAMAPTPVRAKGAEQALRGATLDEAGIAAACAALATDLQPQDDALASAWYRARVAPVHLKRLLLERR